jgi:hypothetical protein
MHIIAIFNKCFSEKSIPSLYFSLILKNILIKKPNNIDIKIEPINKKLDRNMDV